MSLVVSTIGRMIYRYLTIPLIVVKIVPSLTIRTFEFPCVRKLRKGIVRYPLEIS